MKKSKNPVMDIIEKLGEIADRLEEVNIAERLEISAILLEGIVWLTLIEFRDLVRTIVDDAGPVPDDREFAFKCLMDVERILRR